MPRSSVGVSAKHSLDFRGSTWCLSGSSNESILGGGYLVLLIVQVVAVLVDVCDGIFVVVYRESCATWMAFVCVSIGVVFDVQYVQVAG